MASFLNNQKQIVTNDRSDSSTKSMKFGVPWALIVHIININDIQNILPSAKFISYADDANIILTVSYSNWTNAFSILPKLYSNSETRYQKSTLYIQRVYFKEHVCHVSRFKVLRLNLIFFF